MHYQKAENCFLKSSTLHHELLVNGNEKRKVALHLYTNMTMCGKSLLLSIASFVGVLP